MSDVVTAQALREYGQAIRGDWSLLDGRSVRAQLDIFASAIDGSEPAYSWTIERWRTNLGVCLMGGGHWDGHCGDMGCAA